MYHAVYPVLGNETKLPFYLSGIGKTAPEFHIRRKAGLASHQFLFTEKGRGILLVNNKRYTLGKNSLLYLPPALPHEYFPEDDAWDTCWMVFRGEMLTALMENMGFQQEIIAEHAELTAFKKLYHRLSGLAADNLHNSQTCSLLIYQSILLARDLFSEQHTGDHTGSLIVDRAVAYIHAHCDADISLHELSALSDVSPQYFGRLFRKRLNMRPMEYIARIKISKAKIMLLNSELPVSEIAAQLGFTSPTYFGIVFKKYESISPSEFRKNKGAIV